MSATKFRSQWQRRSNRRTKFRKGPRITDQLPARRSHQKEVDRIKALPLPVGESMGEDEWPQLKTASPANDATPCPQLQSPSRRKVLASTSMDVYSIKGSAHGARAGAGADFSLHTKHIDYTHTELALALALSLRQLQLQLRPRVRSDLSPFSALLL